MDIGSALKKSRTETGLTQEQAARELGISRQTLSSWENGRSYPGIQAVLDMASLYNVTLDELLKGLPREKGYLSHLKETAAEHNGTHFWWKALILILSALAWCSCLMLSWSFFRVGDSGGGQGLWMLELMCASILIFSMVIGFHGLWGRWMCLIPIWYGLGFALIPVLTRLEIQMTVSDLGLLPLGSALSFSGICLGRLFDRGRGRAASD